MNDDSYVMEFHLRYKVDTVCCDVTEIQGF